MRDELSLYLPEENIKESGYLEAMLNNFSASYKLYWFRGIFKEILDGRKNMSYKRVVARMIAAAWFPVLYYHLSLGFSDKLTEAISYICEEMGIPRERNEDLLVEDICESEDPKLLQMISNLTNMVPTRLIRPFYEQTINEKKVSDSTFNDSKIDHFIRECNESYTSDALYKIEDSKNAIGLELTVSDHWFDFIRDNAAIIEGWLNYKLISYLQKRNPNVPAIPFKIYPPQPSDRNLTTATKYWRTIQQEIPLYDLYNGVELTEENCRNYGAFSVDHFIPWSFVLHNEIWNLYPSFKNINSGKNDRLPDQKRYLIKFCEAQYRGFIIAKQKSSLRRILEDFRTVRSDIIEIEDSDRGHEVFVNALEQTISPLYQIASNQGYLPWRI
jgi:hypothetical protein